jgi:thymidylate kinase
MFVALEGLSGVGKSTVVGPLADALGAICVPTVPMHFGRDRNYFVKAEQREARFLYFMSAVSLAALEVRARLETEQPVVVESYFARTLAFHRGMGCHFPVATPSTAPTPDATFYLTCSEAERLRRLASRRKPRTLWDHLAEQRVEAIDREYRAFPMHVIDTTSLTPNDVVTAILTHSTNGRCNCANPQRLAGHPNLLSAVRSGASGS